MDTINVTPRSNGTLASPKLTKTKSTSSAPGAIAAVAYGCEHIQVFWENTEKKVAMQQYAKLVRTINDQHSSVLQTYKPLKGSDGNPITCLAPLYLCLQCPTIHTASQRDKHLEAKGHAFYADSTCASVYCVECQDYIYDPSLEDVRVLKGRKKRKLDEYIGSADEQRLVSANSTFVPCRAIGLRGMYNMGMTCFISVIIQSLIHNPFIKAYWLSEGHKSSTCEKEKEGCAACALDEMFCEYYSLEKTEGFGAVSMLMGSWLGDQELSGYAQQDAHQYLQSILGILHQESGGSVESKGGECSCIVHKIFYGKLQSSITCDKCRNVSTTFDPVLDLSLDLRQTKKKKVEDDAVIVNAPVDIKDCLERFTSKEKLPASGYTCQNCSSSQAATKQLSIQRLPPVLVIHLKRFASKGSSASKLETKVRFPIQLDMYPYTSRQKSKPKSSHAAGPPPTCPYELSSVVVHKGNLDTGHYVNYAREGSDWFLFDDSKVVLASEAEVLDANAYLLMYIVKELDT